MRIYGDKVQKTIHQLRKDTDKLCDEHLTKIYIKIKYYVNNYSHMLWPEGLEVILQLFYGCLEKVYANTSKVLKELYGDVEPYSIKDIEDLAYDKDGKTLTERITEYWHKAEERINAKDKLELVILYLFNRYTVILTTETRMVEQGVKKNKKPIPEPSNYGIMVIEGCGGECGTDCLNYNGIYREDDEVPWPPYHPNCTGIAYYDIIDDLDDIHDLDLDDTDLDDLDV